MGALHSKRMEMFCRHLLETGVQSQAYLKAGYKASNRNNLDSAASKLSRSPKVKARIRELQGHIVVRNRITVDSLVAELDEARVQAVALSQPSAAITATMSKARLTGLLVDRKETGAPGEFSGLQSEQAVIDLVKAELGTEAAQQLLQALAQADMAEQAEVIELPHEVDPPPIEPTNDGSGTVQ